MLFKKSILTVLVLLVAEAIVRLGPLTRRA